MEEKNLLKEITYLSRLIGQHKNKLKNNNIVPSNNIPKATNKIFSVPRHSNVTPVQNPKTVSMYKINHTMPQNSLKPSVAAAVKTVIKDPDVQERRSIARSDNSALNSQINRIKQKGDASGIIADKKSSGVSSSVHINPNFFTNLKNTREEIGSLRCKSVHINPRLLDAGVEKTNECVLENKMLLSRPPANISQNQVLPPNRSSKPVNSSKSQPVSVLSHVSALKCINSSTPLRTPTSKKKYVYQSKTKLVKACANSPAGDNKLKKSCVTPVTSQNAAKIIKTPHGGTLLAVSRTKLVRLPGKIRRASSSKSASCNTPSPVTKSRYSLHRVSPSIQASSVIRTTRRVSLKYKSTPMVMMLGIPSKYQLDHRVAKSSRKGRPSSSRSQYKVDHRSLVSAQSIRGPRVHSHLLISPLRRSSYLNQTWTSTTPRIVQKVAISHKKLSRIGCSPGSRKERNSALVRIGGLLYKSSPTKLILSKSSEKKMDTSKKPCTVVKRRNLNAGHIVYVRGNKFVMDQSGKTLKRVMEDLSRSPSARDKKRNRVSRVDIGGVTYIQKTPSVLVRTNTHTARNVVSNAKQRSIAFLAQKMRKINTPCLFYRRFGRCPRLKKGRCELVHDPKLIDICKKFLQGKCTIDGCLLSHDVGPEKMPTCRFFLEGCCVREFCPYLHVKVNDHAPICRSFLQGYCADGPECLKRHILLCPDYDKNGSCAKGKYCPYPHSIPSRVQRAGCSDPPITPSGENEEEDQDDKPVPQKRKRYYETDSDEQLEDDQGSSPSLKAKRYYDSENETEAVRNIESQDPQSDAHASEDDVAQSTIESPCSTPLKKRPKIGDLPSFIALESSEFE